LFIAATTTMKRKSKATGKSKRPRRPARATRWKRSSDGSLTAGDLHEILDKLNVGVSVISRHGRVVYVNAYARGLFEMPDRDPIGLSTEAYEPYTIWPDGRVCPAEEYPPTRCLRDGELQASATLGLKLPGGRVRWVTVAAAPILHPKTGIPECAIVTVAESSEPVHIEQSLRESEDRYRRLIELAPDAIIVHRGGPIAFINDAGVRLYGGKSREEFIGRDVIELVPPASRDKVRRRIADAMEGRATPLDVQRHVRLDGRPVYVEVTGTRCVYRGENCVQVVIRDVTERRRAERALQRAKAELERRVAQRTEELSRKNAELKRERRLMERTMAMLERDRKLAAYDIHDTILQDVIGAVMFLDAISESNHAAPPPREQLDQARKLLRHCIDEARRMISGLRPFIIDDQGIVGGIEYLVNEHNARGQAIQFRQAMRQGRLAPDLETTVFRIVQEALSNIERHSRSPKGEVTIAHKEGRLHIVVRDWGVGFDPQAVGEGHYGLEGIRERARLAGGTATIKSAPRKGTEVTVVLPVADDAVS
jgi:PAS domain S-box-containing protein